MIYYFLKVFCKSRKQREMRYFFSNLCFFQTSIYFCVCVKRKTFCNCLYSSSSCDSASLIGNIRELRAKNYFTDHRTANRIQLFVSMKSKFSGIFFSRTSRSEGEFPIGYLINIVTCLFPCH